MPASRSAMPAIECCEDFLYILKAGLRAAACGGRPRPAAAMVGVTDGRPYHSLSTRQMSYGDLASVFHEPGVGFAGRGVTGVGGGRRVAFGAAGRSRWDGRWAWRSASSGGAAQP